MEREAGPLEVDAATGDDQATAVVVYPSIWDVWPEVYTMTHVSAVEVHSFAYVRLSAVVLIFVGLALDKSRTE